MNFGYDFVKKKNKKNTHGMYVHGSHTPRKSRINVFT